MRRIFAFSLILVLAAAASPAAHRLDEYLQASRLAIGNDEVALELDLTPGATIAAHVVALVDRDADGLISPLEAEAYGRSAVQALVLEVDGRAVPLALTRVEASSIAEMREGTGSIQIVAVGRLHHPVASGTRHLLFRNNHHPNSSVYLVNALVPQNREIVVGGQRRDTSQRELHLEYDVRPAWPMRLVWLTLGLTGVGVLFVIRKPKRSLVVSLSMVLLLPLHSDAQVLERIPDKLVVLTFDDSKASHYTVVRPLLKKYGFGGTFFITEGFTFRTNKDDYLTWDQIRELHQDGFEIGNHTRDHMGVSKANLPRLKEQVEAINAQCAAHGIPAPTSFAYPGNAIDPGGIRMIEELGFQFARRGGAPEYPYQDGDGVAYEPGRDHPLLLPSAGDARPFWTLDNLTRATSQAKDGRIAILQFHGAPDVEHPWVHTPRERFEEYMAYLHSEGFKAIALRDLAKYVDWRRKPDDPWKVIEQRKSELARPPG